MTFQLRRPPVPAIDDDGRSVLLIPLASHQGHAKVFPEDYQRLCVDGFVSPSWQLNCGVIRVADHRKNPQRVARLIAEAGPEVRVGYADGNPANLRRDNLVLRPFTRHRPDTHRGIRARPFSPPPSA